MGTLKCTFELAGVSPLGFSAPINSLKNTGETHDAFEERTWRERVRRDDAGFAYMVPMAIKNMLSESAKFLSETVGGKGKATFTKHFEAGILVIDRFPILVKGEKVKADEIPGQRLFVPASGKRGDGKRVWKTFPVLEKWSVKCELYAVDPVLIDKPDKIREYLVNGGKLIGLGMSRPRNNGYWGRFDVVNFKATKEE